MKMKNKLKQFENIFEKQSRQSNLSQKELLIFPNAVRQIHSCNLAAWHRGNSKGQVQAVAQKQPNELGLYDMTGNVLEWCWDLYNGNYYKYSPKENPKGPEKSGWGHIVRGGRWFYTDEFMKITRRGHSYPNDSSYYIGFRVVLVE